MKKLIYLLLFVCVNLGAQSYTWTPTLNIATLKGVDTVLQPTRAILPDVAGRTWSVTISTTNLNNYVTLSFGASNKTTKSTKTLVGFEGIENDSLPYRFYKNYNRVITNGDTTYQKSFTFSTPFNFLRPQVKIWKNSATSGTIMFDFLFNEE